MEALSKELDFQFTAGTASGAHAPEEDQPDLQALLSENGTKNGVGGAPNPGPGCPSAMEPNMSDEAVVAVRAHRGHRCPFGLNIALPENACANGVKFKFDPLGALNIEKSIRPLGKIQTDDVVHAAGSMPETFTLRHRGKYENPSPAGTTIMDHREIM